MSEIAYPCTHSTILFLSSLESFPEYLFGLCVGPLHSHTPLRIKSMNLTRVFYEAQASHLCLCHVYHRCWLLWPWSSLDECGCSVVVCSLLSLLLSSLCWKGAEEAGCQACVQHSLQAREVVVVEEAGFQACEKLSPGERVCWEVVFSQRESNTSHGALRIPDLACCRDLEREVKNRWTVLVKVYTPGWNKHVGNEIL
jgi:hypothetical protein